MRKSGRRTRPCSHSLRWWIWAAPPDRSQTGADGPRRRRRTPAQRGCGPVRRAAACTPGCRAVCVRHRRRRGGSRCTSSHPHAVVPSGEVGEGIPRLRPERLEPIARPGLGRTHAADSRPWSGERHPVRVPTVETGHRTRPGGVLEQRPMITAPVASWIAGVPRRPPRVGDSRQQKRGKSLLRSWAWRRAAHWAATQRKGARCRGCSGRHGARPVSP